MIEGSARWDGYSDLTRHIDRVRDGLANLGPLAARVAQIVAADNAAARAAGEGRDGKPLAPLARSTADDRRRGPGPPLTPRGPASDDVAGFRVRTRRGPGGTYSIVGSWDGAPWLKYHTAGATRPGTAWRLPARDIVGVRPVAAQQIDKAVQDYIRDLLDGE